MNRLEGAELIGLPAWRILVSRHGGCEIDVPTSAGSRRGQELADLIGTEAAHRLIRYAGGDNLYIAAGWEQVLCNRYAEIVALHEQGMTPAQIARKWRGTLSYTERNIRMILAGRYEVLRDSIAGGEQLGIPGI